MSTWTARRLAWAIGILSMLLMAGALVLMFLDRNVDMPKDVGAWGFNDVFDLIVTFGVPILGIVIVNKQPRNAIGWLFLTAALALGLETLGQTYAAHTLVADPGSLAGGRALAWVSNVVWPIPVAVLILIFLLFPTGHPVTPRWRIVGWFTVAMQAVLFAASMIIATTNWSDPFYVVADPQPGVWANAARIAVVISVLAELVALLLSVVSVVIRYRRSTGVERLQLKWFVSAAAVAGVTFSVGVFSDAAVVSALVSISLLGLWFAIGIAMVKHSLFDIDVILNKAIAYGALAVIFTAVYVLVVVVIGAVIGVTEGLSLVATAIVAVAFQPLRERAQHFANRLVYGERATPYEVLSRFSEQVGETYSGEDIHVRMVRLLAEGTGATSAGVWLMMDDEFRPVATWPTNGLPPSVPASGGPAPFEEATMAVPVKHRGDLLGMLTLVKPPNDPLTPVEETMVNDLAGQAALLLANSVLVEDLRASRQRLVAAQDEERRRLERNLHDGAQQQLVALGVQLSLAQRQARGEAPDVAETLERLQAQTTDALENLRDLARGVYPPLLADQGLAAAIDAQARRSPLPVRVESDGTGRYPQEVETAVYSRTLEALQNHGKYAHPEEVVVRLREEGGDLVFTIEDDGQGFDRATTKLGSGLQNMFDRLEALGGELFVDSRPGEGTIVEGRIAVPSGIANEPAPT